MKFNYKRGSATKPGKIEVTRVPFDFKPVNLDSLFAYGECSRTHIHADAVIQSVLGIVGAPSLSRNDELGLILGVIKKLNGEKIGR